MLSSFYSCFHNGEVEAPEVLSEAEMQIVKQKEGERLLAKIPNDA